MRPSHWSSSSPGPRSACGPAWSGGSPPRRFPYGPASPASWPDTSGTGLTPETIAAAHQISVRHLYTLFAEQGLTVAAWIRRCRLEQCHRDLADPRRRSLPIQSVAARWGFTDAATFSRAFRAAYGMSPRDHRDLAAAGRAPG
ncbi:helix-turn-helix domain-containing protein [Microbispora sp. NPDC004025]